MKSTDIKPELSQFSKDTVLPKKPLPAFFSFSIVNGKKMREANKELKMTECGKLNKEAWDKLAANKKKEYENLAV